LEDGHPVRFYRPQLAPFEQSHNFIQDIGCEEGDTLIALDQPTLVPNASGMHPDAQSGAGRILDRHD
jgi:predicted RNase H-like nuclease